MNRMPKKKLRRGRGGLFGNRLRQQSVVLYIYAKSRLCMDDFNKVESTYMYTVSLEISPVGTVQISIQIYFDRSPIFTLIQKKLLKRI